MADIFQEKSRTGACSSFEVFFSLRGSLPRDAWRCAMILSASVFTLGVSLLCRTDEGAFAPPSGAIGRVVLAAWYLGYVTVLAILCAKRLLDIPRPLWLALPIPATGLLCGIAAAMHWHPWALAMALLAALVSTAAVPALLACAFYEPDVD
jgi:uncharacterized membrane protein YhaH (DUF805 family)